MRVVVVGLGVQGRKRLKIAGDSVVATVDPVLSDADHRSLKDLPLDSYDAALLCVPDDAKLELLAYLLEAGKHVLVEKPLLGTDVELGALEALSARSHAVCYTAYNHRFEPHFVRLKELLDSGKLGDLYLVRMFYGNGTARDVRSSGWRDQGAGVIPDLGSHLLDTMLFWLGEPGRSFELRAAHRFENRAFDHFTAASAGIPAIEIEATLVSWRNHMTVDVYGEHGSAHIESLCKWGPSRFTERERVLPSGRPPEHSVVLTQADPTWELEYRFFRDLCDSGRPGNIANDRWIARELQRLSEAALDSDAS
ncbi:MAG: Gfo/Idh/MocA family oxidoreductase [bacterium]|nr:Gfo/Idh/MocA family oxidoreductase [bacterium]